MKFNFERMPALKSLIAFLLGFAVYSAIKPRMDIVAAVAAITLAAAVSFFIWERRSPGRIGKNYFREALSAAICFCLAAMLYGANDAKNIAPPDGFSPEMKAVAKGKVIKIISRDRRKTRLLLEGWTDAKPLAKKTLQSLLINLYGPKKIALGDELLISGAARFPKRATLPGEFDEAAWLRALDVSWVMRAKAGDVAVVGKSRGLEYYSELASDAVQEKLDGLYAQRQRGLISALLTGARAGLTPEEQREFSLTGIAHILSVSGLHVGVFAAAIAALLGFISLRWAKFAIFSALVAAFVAITGFQPPAVRAGAGAILFYYCFARELRAHPLNVISFALLAYLIISPNLIYSASFQMSSAAAFGILLLYKPFLERLNLLFRGKNPVSQFFAQSFAVSFAAGVAVSPIVAHYFQVFSIVSPLANLTAAPLSSLALIYGMLSVAFSYFAPWASVCFAAVASLSCDLLVYLNRIALSFPSAYVEGAAAFPAAVGVSGALVYLAFAKSGRHLAFRVGVSAVALILAFNLTPDKAERKIEIYPRDQYVAVVIPDSSASKFVLIADRKPHTYPFRDFAMENYLINDKDFLILAYDGNAGINLCDAVKKSKRIREERASFAALRFLKEKLSLAEQIPQITYFPK